MNRKVNRIILACVVFSVVSVEAQRNDKMQVIDAKQSSFCEYTQAIFDSFSSGITKGSTVIILGYQSTTEVKNDAVLQRLQSAESYLRYRSKSLGYSSGDLKIINGIALEKRKQGALNFYLKGNLELEINFFDNRKLKSMPCVSGNP